MLDSGGAMNQQYGIKDLNGRILAALQKAGKNIDALTREDLSTFDEFHFGGISATRRLAQLGGLCDGMLVLDVGSGLGGPARTLAAEYGCRVIGIDLTEAFTSAAEMLTERTGLANQVKFEHGNALDMPFEDRTFDVVWTQFAAMNIPDREGLYRECRRVLKDGGRFAFHEVMTGGLGDLYLPVFWANDPSLSFLKSPAQIQNLLAAQGFMEIAWQDVTQESLQGLMALQARVKREGPPALDLSVFIQDSVPQKLANVVRNLQENRIRVVQAAFELKRHAA